MQNIVLMLSLLLVSALVSANSTTSPVPSCSLNQLAACDDINRLYWSPGFKKAVTQFMGGPRGSEAFYLYQGPLAQQQLDVLGGGPGSPEQVDGLYFFTSFRAHSAKEQGAIFMDRNGQIIATAILWSPCSVKQRKTACNNQHNLTVFIHGAKKERKPIMDKLSQWAKTTVEHFYHSPGLPSDTFNATEVVDPLALAAHSTYAQCTLKYLEACRNLNWLYWTADFAPAIIQFMDKQANNQAAYLYRGPLAEQQIDALGGYGASPSMADGLYFFTADRGSTGSGAIVLNRQGQIIATAMLWSPCAVAHPDRYCSAKNRLTVFIHASENKKSTILAHLTQWAKAEVKNMHHHNSSSPPDTFNGVEIIDPASNTTNNSAPVIP